MANGTKWRAVLAAAGCIAALGACGDDGHGKAGPDHGAHGDHDDHDDHDGHEGHAGEGGHEGDHVALSVAAMAEAAIEVGRPGPGRIEIAVEFPGEVVVDPDRIAHISPRVAGSALVVYAALGARVEAGEVLAVIESPELGAARIEFLDAARGLEVAKADHERQRTISGNTRRLLDLLATGPTPERARDETADAVIGEDKSRLLTAYANLDLARRTRDREEELFARKISAEADVLAARNAFDGASADWSSARETVAFAHGARLLDAERALRLAEARLQNRERHLHLLGVAESEIPAIAGDPDEGIARYMLRSPIAGTVIEKHLVLGESVDPSTGVFVVADLSGVQVKFSVWPAELARVRPGLAVRVRVDGIGEEASATVDSVSPLAREKTRTADGRVRLPNPDGRWRPGLFGTVRVVVEEVDVPLTVPAEAVLRHEGGEVVFVEEEARNFEARPVRVGRRGGGVVEILSGVTGEDRVVVKNAFVLKAELGKEAGGHDH